MSGVDQRIDNLCRRAGSIATSRAASIYSECRKLFYDGSRRNIRMIARSYMRD